MIAFKFKLLFLRIVRFIDKWVLSSVLPDNVGNSPLKKWIHALYLKPVQIAQHI